MSNSRARNGTLTDSSEIAWVYNSGEGIVAMAKRYGLPISTMRHRLMKARVSFRPAGNPTFKRSERGEGEK